MQQQGSTPRGRELTVKVARGDDGSLGVQLNKLNVVVKLDPAAPAAKTMQLGDKVVEIDGVVLNGRPAGEVLKKAPTHTFKILRTPTTPRASPRRPLNERAREIVSQ